MLRVDWAAIASKVAQTARLQGSVGVDGDYLWRLGSRRVNGQIERWLFSRPGSTHDAMVTLAASRSDPSRTILVVLDAHEVDLVLRFGDVVADVHTLWDVIAHARLEDAPTRGGRRGGDVEVVCAKSMELPSGFDPGDPETWCRSGSHTFAVVDLVGSTPRVWPPRSPEAKSVTRAGLAKPARVLARIPPARSMTGTAFAAALGDGATLRTARDYASRVIRFLRDGGLADAFALDGRGDAWVVKSSARPTAQYVFLLPPKNTG